MITKNVWLIPLLSAALGLGLASTGLADGDAEWGGIQSRRGDPSPENPRTIQTDAATGLPTSNLDDYTHQNEQINIAGDKDAILKVLRVDQKNLLNDYRVGVFPIQHASPIEIRNVFRMIAAVEGGRAEVIRDRERGENFLFVLAPDFQLPFIEAALNALDHPWVKDNVDGSAEGYVRGVFRDIANVVNITRSAASAAVGPGGDNLIVLDEPANAAYIKGEPSRVRSFKSASQRVDQPVPQILLEAVVYEVDVSNMKQIGLDYIAWKNGPGRNLFQLIYWGGSYRQTAEDMTSILDPFVGRRQNVDARFTGRGRGFYRSANFMLTAAYLDFLEGSGRARVITRGKVLVKNGTLGTLDMSDEVIHYTVAPTANQFGVSADAYTEQGAQLPMHRRTVEREGRVNVGFRMDIVPWIGQETTELQIQLDLNNLVGLTPSGPPQLRSHSMTATALVKDGEEICITGLRRTEDVKQTQKMPVLGSLPVVGWLFGQERTVQRETEVVVVLHPRVFFGSEAEMVLANTRDDRVRQKVEREVALRLPSTEYGFDQWLIGKDR